MLSWQDVFRRRRDVVVAVQKEKWLFRVFSGWTQTRAASATTTAAAFPHPVTAHPQQAVG
jgi:hypothetical protein